MELSYDIELAVKAEGAEEVTGKDCYVVFAEPEYDSPTYNLGPMFRACTGWDFEQSKWYSVSEVLPLIEHGIHELRFNRSAYIQFEPKNGWGTIDLALKTLEFLLKCIQENNDGEYARNHIPLECMYVRW